MTIKLELFYSPYCPRCCKARERVRSIVTSWPARCFELCEVNVVNELDRAVAVGVLQTPALAIDGQLVVGPLPSLDSLQILMRQRLKGRQSP